MTEKWVPTNVEAEESVLSHLLSAPRKITEVVDRLSPEHFCSDRASRVYQLMVTLAHQGKACTVSNVYDAWARAYGVDDEVYDFLEDRYGLFSAFMTPFEDQVEKVIRVHTMRRLISAAQHIAEVAYAQDDNAMDVAEQLIYDIARGVDGDTVATLAQVKQRYMQEFEQRRENLLNGIANGIPTGFHELDVILGGLQPSNLYTLAARPSLGKTALALNFALYIARHARRCLFFSLEMSELELFQRLLAIETPVDQSFLRDGDVNEQELEDIRYTANDLAELDMLIDDRTYTLAGICSKARREHARKPLNLIVVDYLQLIDTSPEGRNKNKMRYEEVGEFSKRLKRLAKELKVPVIAIAQLNRDVESRQSPKPRMSDLGESGKLEQDMDVVAFVYCEETELAKKENCEPYKVHVHVAKHRNGRLGDVELWFRPRITKFQDEEPDYEQ